MSDPLILVLGTAADADESEHSLRLLEELQLPNAVKYVLTTGKFDARGAARTFNIEAGYPGEPAILRTLAAWAELPSDARARDGYDLFCLKRLLEQAGSFDLALLLRGSAIGIEAEPDLAAKMNGRHFLIFPDAADAEPASVLFNLSNADSRRFLDLGCELFATGAVYGLSPYSLNSALEAADDALRLEQQVAAQL